MKTIVQKYGGSSLASNEAIVSVAKAIQKQWKENPRICVVVSAMGKTTNQLFDRAHAIAAHPSPRELDMLLTCGERISMALLAIALNELSIPSISFTGSQAGIITDDVHRDAKISHIRPARVIEALDEGKIVIIAGFQGVTKNTKEITTLSRGGSDTTAVHMAAALGADTCEIYTDVAGIYSSDPNLDEDAQLIPHLTYSQMQALADTGAKVLHPDAVQAAQSLGIRIVVGKSGNVDLGSVVDNEPFADIESRLWQNGSARGINL